MTALRPISLRPLLILTLTLTMAGSGRSVLAQTTKPATPPTAKEKTKKTEKKETVEPVDLNSATAEELMTLPGVGEAIARKIIDARPHKTVEDLAAVGVPARRIEEIKPLAIVRPVPVAIDLNNDALIRVETLPGVGPALAKEIIAARPLNGFEDLAKVKGFGVAKVDSLKGRVKFGKAEPVKAEPMPKTKTESKTTKSEPKEETVGKSKSESKTAKVKEAGQPGNKIDLNTASLEELDALPGIGQVYAQEIVKGRPYAKIEDIMKLKGIKEVEFGKLRDLITVGK